MGNVHVHPRLKRPISVSKFLGEFAWMWRRSGLRLTKRVEFSEELDARHERSARNYAEVELSTPIVFRFARAVLCLPQKHRLGILAHECGHVLAPGSEQAADVAAAEVLGVLIAYDRRFPSVGARRGLQFAAEIRR